MHLRLKFYYLRHHNGRRSIWRALFATAFHADTFIDRNMKWHLNYETIAGSSSQANNEQYFDKLWRGNKHIFYMRKLIYLITIA